MDRIAKKFKTALNYIPEPEISSMTENKLGLIYLGTTDAAIPEVRDSLVKKGITFDTMRIRSFPFHQSVAEFIEQHETVFVIEQNRDQQLRSLLKIECDASPEKLKSIQSYNGILITADQIERDILKSFPVQTDTESVSA